MSAAKAAEAAGAAAPFLLAQPQPPAYAPTRSRLVAALLLTVAALAGLCFVLTGFNHHNHHASLSGDSVAASSWAVSSADLIPYIPSPGRWESSTVPTDVTVQVTGAAVGEILITTSSMNVKNAVATVACGLSHERLAADIKVTAETELKSRFKLVVSTPDRLSRGEIVKVNIVVTLPEIMNFFHIMSLTVMSENADVVIDDTSRMRRSLNAINIQTTNGAIRSSGVAVDSAVSFSTHTGEIVASGISTSKLFLRSTNGRITVTDSSAKTGAGLVVETENGAASLARVRTTALHVNTAGARAPIFFDDVIVSEDSRIRGGASVHGQISVGDSAAISVIAEQAVLLVIDGAPLGVSASTIAGPIRIAVSDPAFSGSFVARSDARRVRVIGGNLHFAKNNGGKDNVWTGWRKDESGTQRVSAYAQDGTVDLDFARKTGFQAGQHEGFAVSGASLSLCQALPRFLAIIPGHNTMPFDITSIHGDGSDDDDDGFDLPEVSVAFEQALSQRAASQALPLSPVKASQVKEAGQFPLPHPRPVATITPARPATVNVSPATERPFGTPLPTMQELFTTSSGNGQSGRSSSEGSIKATPHPSNASQNAPATPTVSSAPHRGQKGQNALPTPPTPSAAAHATSPPPTLRERLDIASGSSSSGRARTAVGRDLPSNGHRSVRRPSRNVVVSSESESDASSDSESDANSESDSDASLKPPPRSRVKRRPVAKCEMEASREEVEPRRSKRRVRRPFTWGMMREDEKSPRSTVAQRQSPRVAARKAFNALKEKLATDHYTNAVSDALSYEDFEHQEHTVVIDSEPDIQPEPEIPPELDIIGNEPGCEDENPLCHMRSQATPVRHDQPAEPQPAWDFENPEAELLLTRLSARLTRLENRLAQAPAISEPAAPAAPREQPEVAAFETRLSGLESMAADLETTQTRLAELKDLLEAVSSANASANAAVGATCGTLAERMSHIEALNQDTRKRLGAQLKSWEREVETNIMQLHNGHQASVRSLSEYVKTLAAGHAHTLATVEKIATGFSAQRDRINALERRLETRFANLEARIAEGPRLEARVANLEARFAAALRNNQGEQNKATLTRIIHDTAKLFKDTAALMSLHTDLAKKLEVFCAQLQTSVDRLVQRLNRDSQVGVEERARVANIENTLALVQRTLREDGERIAALLHLQVARVDRAGTSSGAPQHAHLVSTSDVVRSLGEQVTSRELQLHRPHPNNYDHTYQLLERLQDQQRQLTTDIDSIRTNHARLAAADRADLRSLRADHATVSSTVHKRAGEVDTRMETMSRELAELREVVHEIRAREVHETRARGEAKLRDEARVRELEDALAKYEPKVAASGIALLAQRDDDMASAAETPPSEPVIPAVIAPTLEPAVVDSAETDTGLRRRRRRADDDVDRRPAKRIVVAAVGVWKWLRGP
ncbi:hypothetical protein HDU88_005510 [Geranomyces variabilis]|nr:hypothetical protein HDU88_005510 [Geranomyces variabilis]